VQKNIIKCENLISIRGLSTRHNLPLSFFQVFHHQQC